MKPALQGFIMWHVTALLLSLCGYLGSCEREDSIYNRILVDLSHEFDEDTIYWVTTKSLHMNVTHNGTAEGGDYWYQIEEISAGTHGGTHLDAPCHFVKGRWCVSDIPLERLIAPAVVIDISGHVGPYPNRGLEKHHLLDWEEKYGEIPSGSIVLINTGWAYKYWPDRLHYTGSNDKDKSKLKFPAVNPEAARWLVENRTIYGFGIDTMSVDFPSFTVPSTHIAFEENNIYNIENLNENLELLPPKGAMLHVMPMKLKGASGAPCRVVATMKAWSSGAICNQHACSATVIVLSSVVIYILWLQTAPLR